MPKVNKQHFVPHFYLKYFSKKDSQNHNEVFYYSKKTKTYCKGSPKSLCKELNVYDFSEVPESDINALENFWTIFENFAGTLIPKIKVQNANLSHLDFDILSDFIATLRIRSPKWLRKLEPVWDKRKINKIDAKDYTLTLYPEMVMEFSKYFKNKSWNILLNQTSIDFITSDFPVYCVPDIHTVESGTLWGINKPKTVINFVLTPRIFITIKDSLTQNGSCNFIGTSEEMLVKCHNILTCIAADDLVIANSQNLLKEAVLGTLHESYKYLNLAKDKNYF